jgi:hypothetical protein
MALLSDVPQPPPEDELSRLQSAFSTSFKHHVFLDFVDNSSLPSSSLPPYLQFAYACLASVTSDLAKTNVSSELLQPEVSSILFIAGANLWSVMLEVDNREARLFEAVVAVSFYPQPMIHCSQILIRRLHFCPLMASYPATRNIGRERREYCAT